ncbi:hypothetical protein LIER_32315 [Lithospermum erythrorhizon]|uniref:Uncharacterized protein n=1 Tax=Lithospermum erythrorhizon TaxID=34254 RepID=A0AAV3RXI4_LITER
MGSLTNPRPSRSQRRLSPTFLTHDSLVSKRSPAELSHEELITSFSSLWDKVEMDYALLERDALRKERESLRAGRDEMLQTNDRLLGQLLEIQRQAQIMEAGLEGICTTEGLGELVRGSGGT